MTNYLEEKNKGKNKESLKMSETSEKCDNTQTYLENLDLDPHTTLFLLTDFQEETALQCPNFQYVIQNTYRLLQAGRLFYVDLIAAEQMGLSRTIEDVEAWHATFITKSSFSAASDRDIQNFGALQQYLSEHPKLRSIVLFGLETQIAIEKTALDLLKRDYNVHVVADCTGSRTDEEHLLALDRLRLAGALIDTSESVIFKLMKGRGNMACTYIIKTKGHGQAGHLHAGSVAFMMCDVQEDFRTLAINFEPMLKNVKKLVKTSQILNIDLLASEQLNFGATVKDVGAYNAVIVPKVSLSAAYERDAMNDAVVLKYLKSRPRITSVVLFGRETHATVEQTALDLLRFGYEVHVVIDCTISRSEDDRNMAIDRMKSHGIFVETLESLLYKFVEGIESPNYALLEDLLLEPSADTGLRMATPKYYQM